VFLFKQFIARVLSHLCAPTNTSCAMSILRYTRLMQNITGLTVGQQYTFSFLAAERPGYGNSESISVTIGNVMNAHHHMLEQDRGDSGWLKSLFHALVTHHLHRTLARHATPHQTCDLRKPHNRAAASSHSHAHALTTHTFASHTTFSGDACATHDGNRMSCLQQSTHSMLLRATRRRLLRP
jgi:hypothetical protein